MPPGSVPGNGNHQAVYGSIDMIEYLGLWLLIAISLNMWALLSVLGSGATLPGKAIWAAALLLLPGIGFFGWYMLGPRQSPT